MLYSIDKIPLSIENYNSFPKNQISLQKNDLLDFGAKVGEGIWKCKIVMLYSTMAGYADESNDSLRLRLLRPERVTASGEVKVLRLKW